MAIQRTNRGLAAALLLTLLAACGGGGDDSSQNQSSQSSSATNEVNERPAFRSEPPTFVLLGNDFSYQAQVSDPNGDALTFLLANAPDGMTLSSSGLAQWTPSATQVGEFVVTLEARDPAGAVARQIFRITVAEQAAAPEFRTRPPSSVMAGSVFRYQPFIEDISGDTNFAFRLVQAPAGMEINATTGAVTWTPGLAVRGDIIVIIEVSNQASVSKQQAFVVQVGGPDTGRIAGFKFNDINADGNRSAIFAGPLSIGVNANDSRILVVNGDGSGGTVASVLRDAGFTVIAASLQIPGSIANALQNNSGINQVWVWNDGSLGNALSAADPSIALSSADATALANFSNSHPHFVFDSLAWRDHDNAAERELSQNIAQALFAADGGIVLGTDDASGPLVVQHVNQVAALFGYAPFIGSYRSFPAQLRQRPALLAASITTIADIQSTNSYANAPSGLQPNGRLLSTIIYAANAEPLAGDLPLPSALVDGESINATNHIVTTTLPFALAAVVEPPLAGITVYIDSNDNGQLDSGEPVANTNADGEFEFNGLSAGTYIVRELLPAGWLQTAPLNNRIEVVLAANEQRVGLVFANRQINQPPQFISQPILAASVGQAYGYDADATDPNPGDVLSYALSSAPAAMTIDPVTGQISWSPTAADIGPVAVVVSATDPVGAVATQAFTITVTGAAPSNRAPQITSQPVTAANEAQNYSYAVQASDPDVGDTLTFSLPLQPAGMQINPQTGLIQWLPSAAEVGSNAVRVRVTDRLGLFAEQSFDVVVAAANIAPQITSAPVTQVNERASYVYPVTANDPNPGDQLTFSLDQAPAAMTINPATGLLQWSPQAADIGQTAVTVRVQDQLGAFDTQSFTVTVVNLNDPPQITSTAVTNAVENALYQYAVTAIDPDVGDTLSYSLPQSPQGMQVNANSGVIQWTPNANQVGSAAVTVRVTDVGGLFAEQSFVVQVANVNNPPQFSSTPVMGAVSGQPYQYLAQATDPDLQNPNSSEQLIFSLDSMVAGMQINPQSGLIDWTPSLNQVGSFAVTVRVTDTSNAFATQSYQVVVSDGNQPPQFTSTAPTQAAVGQTYQYQATASDPNTGDSLAFSVDSGPTGLGINPMTGLVEWSPLITQTGTASVVIRVTDAGGLFDSQAFDINVISSNSPPQITSTAVTKGTTGPNGYQYQVQASDVDLQDPNAMEELSYSLPTAPTGMTIDAKSGLILWSPSTPTQPMSPEPVVVRVTDTALAFDEQSFAVDIETATPVGPPGNNTPLQLNITVTPLVQPAPAQVEISLQGSGDGNADGQYSLTVNGIDVPLDAANFGTFDMTAPGRFEATGTVTAKNGDTATATEIFRGTAPNDSQPPQASIDNPRSGSQVKGIVGFDGTASDANLFEYRLEFAPAQSANFVLFETGIQNVNQGVLGGLDTSNFIPGEFQIRLTVEDVNGATATASILIQVVP